MSFSLKVREGTPHVDGRNCERFLQLQSILGFKQCPAVYVGTPDRKEQGKFGYSSVKVLSCVGHLQLYIVLASFVFQQLK